MRQSKCPSKYRISWMARWTSKTLRKNRNSKNGRKHMNKSNGKRKRKREYAMDEKEREKRKTTPISANTA